MTRERAKAVYETESADVVERFRAAGWEVIEELTAPPAAGGVAFVLGWLRDGEPVYPDEGRA
jgi:hypothetical protein